MSTTSIENNLFYAIIIMNLLCGRAVILLLSVYLSRSVAHLLQNICTQRFIAASFICKQTWRQPNCLTAEE